MSVPSVSYAGSPPKGITPASSPEGREGFLSDVIVELGFADRSTVEQAVRTARNPGTTVARVLVETGTVTEGQLAQATAERLGLPYVDLDVYTVDPSAANLLEPATARRYRCVPVGFAGPKLLLAMADPADALGAGDVAALLNRDVMAAVAPASAIEALTAQLPLPEPPGLVAVTEESPSAADPEPAPESSAPAGEIRELQELRVELEETVSRLAHTTAELDAARAEASARSAELAAGRSRAEAAERTVEDALRRAAAAESAAEETRTRVDQLHEADRRADHARLALAAMRDESEREREQLALEARDLRAKATTEEKRRRLLEERLAEVETGALAAERALQELSAAQLRMHGSLRAPAEPDPAEDAGD